MAINLLNENTMVLCPCGYAMFKEETVFTLKKMPNGDIIKDCRVNTFKCKKCGQVLEEGRL